MSESLSASSPVSSGELPPLPPGKGLGSPVAIVAVGSALFMQFIDSTALTTALPTLAREFGARPTDLRLVLTTYLVVQALFLPASGWAADRFGSRRVFMAAMATFLVGSLLCGLSHSLPQLVAARVVQGLGGAMMIPVGRIIVVGSAPRDQLVKAMMWLTLPALAGPLVGPPLSGFILNVASWPWIFFVNIPVGLLGMLAVHRFVPRLLQPNPGRFDSMGFGLSALAILAIMTVTEASGLSVAVQIGAALVAAPAAALYVLHARRLTSQGRRPVLDLSLFRHPTFTASQIGGSLVRLGIGGTPYLLSLLLQIALKWTPLYAGLVLTASALGALGSRPLGPWIIRKLGFRNMLMLSAVVVGVLGAAPGFFRNSTPVALVVGILLVTGFMRAAQFSSVNALAYADVPQSSVSAASTLSSVIQQITLSLGVTLGSLSLQLSQHGRSALTPDGFIIPFLVIGGLSLISVVVYVRLPPGAGAEISGHGRERV